MYSLACRLDNPIKTDSTDYIATYNICEIDLLHNLKSENSAGRSKLCGGYSIPGIMLSV